MKTMMRITFLDDEGQKFFGEGPARLLRRIEEYGSLRAAAMNMNMAYTKALKLMNHAEEALGFPLTERTTGGKSGGGSVLTHEGRNFLNKYEAYRDACNEECMKKYRQFFPKIGCVIMASGMGMRFGGNKLMADFCGEPMIMRAIKATDGLFDSRIVVTRHEDINKLCKALGLDSIVHDKPYRSDTVRIGLEALKDVDACMFLPGDQPLLKRETVAKLLALWDVNRDSIIRPCFGNEPGSPVIFPRSLFPELLNLPEGKGGGFVIKSHPDMVKTLEIDDKWELEDADTPKKLETLKGFVK
ncbi:MAG: NTP transferase domain-containing protein [Clostridia bacterium]|nr:NTP transferase domain-containing protein [Clostridia bacterium]